MTKDLFDDCELKEHYGRLESLPPGLPPYQYRCTDTGNPTAWEGVTQEESDTLEDTWGRKYRDALMARRTNAIVTDMSACDIDELEHMAHEGIRWRWILAGAFVGGCTGPFIWRLFT